MRGSQGFDGDEMTRELEPKDNQELRDDGLTVEEGLQELKQAHGVEDHPTSDPEQDVGPPATIEVERRPTEASHAPG